MSDSLQAFPMSTLDGYSQLGLTKREYFALHILTGIRASMPDRICLYEETARMAVNQADYLMDELEK